MRRGCGPRAARLPCLPDGLAPAPRGLCGPGGTPAHVFQGADVGRLNGRPARAGTRPSGRDPRPWRSPDPAPSPRRPLHARTSHASALAPAGCELSGHTRSFTFKVEEEDDTEHVLALNMVRGRRGWRCRELGDPGWGVPSGCPRRAAPLLL